MAQAPLASPILTELDGVKLTVTRSIDEPEEGGVDYMLSVEISAAAYEAGLPCGALSPEDLELHGNLSRHCKHEASEWVLYFSQLLAKIEAAARRPVQLVPGVGPETPA